MMERDATGPNNIEWSVAPPNPASPFSPVIMNGIDNIISKIRKY